MMIDWFPHHYDMLSTPCQPRPNISSSTQVTCDKLYAFCLIKGWTWCHKAFWRGCTLCYYDKPSTSNPELNNTWTDRTGVGMAQEWIVTAEGLLGGWILWVKMSHGWIVGGRIISAPQLYANRVLFYHLTLLYVLYTVCFDGTIIYGIYVLP